MKSTASLVLVLKALIRVRVRVTKLVYQIGFTTFFRSQGWENILAASSKQQQAASSKQQAAASRTHFCLSAYLRQHRRDIAQTFMVDSPNDALQADKVWGQNSPRGRVGGQKSLKNPEILEKLSPGQGGGGTGVGDHFGTIPHSSVTIDGTWPKLSW